MTIPVLPLVLPKLVFVAGTGTLRTFKHEIHIVGTSRT